VIHRISSSLRTFKSLEFRDRLNIVMSDKSPESSRKHTRNRSGKSSLIATLHFLLGGNCDKESIFRGEALEEHFFALDLDVGSDRVQVRRSGSMPSRIFLDCEAPERWQDLVSIDEESGDNYISNENWKHVLAHEFFGLTSERGPRGPSFRSLISYFTQMLQ